MRLRPTVFHHDVSLAKGMNGNERCIARRSLFETSVQRENVNQYLRKDELVTSLSKAKWPQLEDVFQTALNEAGAALSAVVQADVSVKKSSLEYCTITELPMLFGNPSTPVAASFFGVDGDMSGYLLLLLSVEGADRLLTILLTDEEMDEKIAVSAFGEIGNIVGSTFLNTVADAFQAKILPTPPQIVRDMVGALLSTLASSLEAQNIQRVPLIRTTWEIDRHEVCSHLVWLPVMDIDQLETTGRIAKS